MRAAPTVHPRGRGEHDVEELYIVEGIGSSPRARGTPRYNNNPALPARFIPAGAGNTARIGVGYPPTAVHPRGRGEHTSQRGIDLIKRGSSPRARGTPAGTAQWQALGRFIPAGAGNTSTAPVMVAVPPVHPRGRGEHVQAEIEEALSDGSSPRARGTPCNQSKAGADRPVHPRGRGEHLAVDGATAVFDGSSPRARGTQHQFLILCLGFRFIPAGAGNTGRLLKSRHGKSVHPRGRGEHVELDCAGACSIRFIPAGAGNTIPQARPAVRRTVHPRGRGEHGATTKRCMPPSGSSPRARGTHVHLAYPCVDSRFIPAGAGNTGAKPAQCLGQSVHPRGRGEHPMLIGSQLANGGSSPRARGTH